MRHYGIHGRRTAIINLGPPLLTILTGFSPLRSHALAPRYNQASLRLAKGWITFTNAIFDSREPPIWVPVPARPQVSVLVDPPPPLVVS